MPSTWRTGGGCLRYGQGHINDTFCVYVQQADGDGKRSVLQRINTDTFRDPAGLMEILWRLRVFAACGARKVVTPSENPDSRPHKKERLFHRQYRRRVAGLPLC